MALTKTYRLPPVSEIVVSTPPGQILAAELRGGQPWALYWHWLDQPSPVGAVHWLRITRLAPEIKGAFAVADDAGTEAFLDLSGGKLSSAKNRPHEGERLLAQVTRPPEDGKRLTLRPDVRLPGRYLLYSPARPGLAASRQIRDKDMAQRLQGILRTHARADEGVIVRAAAADLDDPASAILGELQNHRKTWESLLAYTGLGPCLPPPGLLETLLVERLGTRPLALSVNSRQAAASLQQAVDCWCPAEPITVEQDRSDPFISSGAQEALDDALQPEVALPGGGRLWIERTRACWTVDIDTQTIAPGAPRDVRQAVNRTAAVEIARQARLRRMAGSIVVDFLRTGDHQADRATLKDLRAAFAEDPAQLRFNDQFDMLGLYAFSRQRLGPDLLAMQADGGRTLAVLNGLNQLSRQSLADQAQRYALVISPSAGKLLPELPKALAEAKLRLGQDAMITTDPQLPPNAFEVRPYKP